jgi:glycine oxidase
MSDTRECIVVGGGAIGLCTALELARAGRSVTLVERGELGRESSWAGGGILTPINPQDYPDEFIRLCHESVELHVELATWLMENTGISPEMQTSGLIRLSFSEDDAAHYDVAAYLKWNDLDAVICSPARARDIEPAITHEIDGALWQPDVRQVRNPRLLAALEAACRSEGVEIRTGCGEVALAGSRDRVTGVRFAAEELSAAETILAAGAWSGEILARDLGLDVPVKPVYGLMLLLEAEPGFLDSIVLGLGRYLIPRADGHILAGSTVEDRGFDKSTDKTNARELLDIACRIAPGLRRHRVKQAWAGLRPGTPDNLPYLGRPEGSEGLIVATGHFRNGLCLAPATARIVGRLVAGEDPGWDLSPYRVGARPTPAQA